MSIVIKGQAVANIDNKSVIVTDFDIETEVHDASRQMGAEYLHIVTGNANGEELVWHVYEYPEGGVNLVEYQSNLNLEESPTFEGCVE